MPTKKTRVGFIPREEVLKIINKLSIENNLSNSKIISILVEEALSLRGIFNNKTGKLTQSYQKIRDESQDFSEASNDFMSNEKFTINTKLGIHKSTVKTNFLKQANQEGLNLQTYKKFLLFLKFQEMMEEYDT